MATLWTHVQVQKQFNPWVHKRSKSLWVTY
jgi:hypothetical protein